MTGRPEQQSQPKQERVEVRRDGHVVARADVISQPEPHGTAKVALDARPGDTPPDARGELVDQVMSHPGVRNSDSVHVVVSLGDAESISRLQEHTRNFNARAAGASSVIEAEIPPSEDS